MHAPSLVLRRPRSKALALRAEPQGRHPGAQSGVERARHAVDAVLLAAALGTEVWSQLTDSSWRHGALPASPVAVAVRPAVEDGGLGVLARAVERLDEEGAGLGGDEG